MSRELENFLLDHAQIKARPEATEFQISNIKRWFENANKKVIQPEEKQFIDKDGDLIPVVPKIKTPLRRLIDKFEKPRLWAFFRDRDVGSPRFPFSIELMISIRSTNASTEALETLDSTPPSTTRNPSLTNL